MCTVTWIPHGADGCYLTSNRDEAPHRAAPEIIGLTTPTGLQLTFPQDPVAGGTWFCYASDGRALCLLNGARHKHRHRPPYRKSRGLVLLDAFQAPSFAHFHQEYNLRGIEPFTLVMIEPNAMGELVWNGRSKDYRQLDVATPHIWASSTLYPADVRRKRRHLFEKFLQKQVELNLASILDFHLYADDDGWNGMVINRQDRVRTVSVTSICFKEGESFLVHRDLIKNVEQKIRLPKYHF